MTFKGILVRVLLIGLASFMSEIISDMKDANIIVPTSLPYVSHSACELYVYHMTITISTWRGACMVLGPWSEED